MTVEDKVWLLELGGLFSSGFQATQVIVLAVTILALAAAIALSIMALRAAASARGAQAEAHQLYAELKRQATDLQAMADDLDRARHDFASLQSAAPAAHQGFTDQHYADEAREEYESPQPIERKFDAPKKGKPVAGSEFSTAGTMPTAILRGLLRRR